MDDSKLNELLNQLDEKEDIIFDLTNKYELLKYLINKNNWFILVKALKNCKINCNLIMNLKLMN